MQRKLVPDLIKECRCTSLSPTHTVHEAATLMTELNIGAIVVVKDGGIVGILTERDIMRKVVAGDLSAHSTALSEVMTHKPDVVTGDCTAQKALMMMTERGYRHLPIVTEDGKPCAMVSVRDLYHAVKEGLQEDLQAVESYVQGGIDSYGA